MGRATEIRHLAETRSTSDDLRRMMSEEELPEFTSVIADYQTGGRGQVGNKWESERGKNLLFSTLVRPINLSVKDQFYLSRAVSIAITEAVGEIVAGVKIKWPNDIYVGDCKLAGILIENNLRGSYINETIIGLGLNVNQTEFDSSIPNPVSLKNLTNRDHDIIEVYKSIISKLESWLNVLNSKEFDAIAISYMPKLYRMDGELHKFSDANGEFMAQIIDVEPDGHLLLRDEQQQIRRYMFKEVEYVIR